MTEKAIDFKQALIAHLQGEVVEYLEKGCADWKVLDDFYASCALRGDAHASWHKEFRIKLRTVMCNGVEVPAPETVAPKVDTLYYTPMPAGFCVWDGQVWGDCIELDCVTLARGLVYLNKEDAIARAKAMLITK